MNIPDLFIRRPIMTTLVMGALLLFGTLAYQRLPVSDLPNVDFPTILVTANLPGASPETMASSVATPLERQFTTIAGLDSMVSSSGLGLTQITLTFTLDRNIDAAAQDVQAAITKAASLLPKDMPTPPSYQKVNPADQPVLYLALSSPTLPLFTVDEYAQTFIAQRVSTVSGVAQVLVFGSQKAAVRVQLDPDALASRGIGIDEVAQAVAQGNVNLPTGTLVWSVPGVHARDQRPAQGCRGVPSPGRRLPQRGPGAPPGYRVRRRRRRERQGGELVQQDPRDRAGHPEAAGHQHRGGGGRHPQAPPDVPDPDARLHRPGDPLRPVRVDPRLGARRQVHAVPGHLPGRPGDLPVPAERLGDRDPQPGASDVDRGDLRRDVPAGLQPGQPLADGPDALGRVRGRRRHRHAREHRPAHGKGEGSPPGGVRRIARDRLHHPVDDPVARRGLHPRLFHGGGRRPSPPRVRGDDHRRDPHLRGRFPHPDAHAVQPVSPAAGGGAARPHLRRLGAGLQRHARGLRLEPHEGPAAPADHDPPFRRPLRRDGVPVRLPSPRGSCRTRTPGCSSRSPRRRRGSPSTR